MENEHLAICDFCGFLNFVDLNNRNKDICSRCKMTDLSLIELCITEKGKKELNKSKIKTIK